MAEIVPMAAGTQAIWSSRKAEVAIALAPSWRGRREGLLADSNSGHIVIFGASALAPVPEGGAGAVIQPQCRRGAPGRRTFTCTGRGAPGVNGGRNPSKKWDFPRVRARRH
eukprot:scaffold9235_cov112-Isochrysis_galbana.AAC.5